MDESGGRAKELFDAYGGHRLQMHREGKLEAYRAYGISRETEAEWFGALIETYTSRLSIRDWDAVARLEALSGYYQDSTMLGKLAAFAGKHAMSADSLVKLRYAEGLIRIIKACRHAIAGDALLDACRLTYRLLESVIASPLVLDPGHELAQFALKDKKSLNARAQKGLKEIEEIANGA